MRGTGVMRGAIWVAALLATTAIASPMRGGGKVRFTVDEASDFSANPAPDGESLLIDLQGSLWTVPAAGGKARRITPDLFEAMRPDWSPDGHQIAAQAYDGGMWHIWLLSADGKRKRQLTSGDYDDSFPRWSPDGGRIAFLSARGGRPAIWTIDLANGALAELPARFAAPGAFGWAADGQSLVVADAGVIRRVTLDGVATPVDTPCRAGSMPGAPSLAPSGRQLAYICAGAQYGALMLRGTDGQTRQIGTLDDVFAYMPRWQGEDRLIYVANGKIRTVDLAGDRHGVIPFTADFTIKKARYRRKSYDFDAASPRPVKGIVAPAISPNGQAILFKALNDLWLTDLRGNVRRITQDAAYENDPVWSPDGRRIAYASDAGGLMQLHVMDMDTGIARPVSGGDHASVAPAWSPDGGQLAFQREDGSTHILNLASGSVRRIAAAVDFPSRPTWSSDGRYIAFSAANEARNRIAIVDVSDGVQRWIDPAPFRSVSTRGDDGPIWSPDGKWLAFSMMSMIWALPVAADGTPTGPAIQLTQEASDAPSWAGDSRHIAYLANGKLRIVDRETRGVRTVPLKLGWTPHQTQGRTVVHAGRLWDGVAEAVRENVDIWVDGNRISAIVPHGDHGGAARLIDASGLTVTPGLFEMHNHQQLRSKYLGDRQGRMWLSYGITSTRSTGDPAYRALEDKEALASGARVGPRHFMTGEMLEGSRLMWSFSRPVEDEAQLKLELSRADALGYDLIKTYMRFRSDWQVRVAQWGHGRLGVSTTSHFTYPGIRYGVDGAEHFGGPTRWGYIFPHLFRGNAYDDIFKGLGLGEVEMTTTNFAGRQSLLELPGLVSDRRVAALYPPWEQASLAQYMGCAARSGPCDFFLTPNEEQSRLTVTDILRIRRMGGAIMVGSDAPLDSFAISSFQNLYTLQKFGLTPFEALQAATMTPARAQGVEGDLGSIAVGKLADLVLVRGTPDRDVRDLMNVTGVMKAGQYFSIDDLIAPFAGWSPRRSDDRKSGSAQTQEH